MTAIITARPSAANDFSFFAGEWDVANDRRNADGVWEQFAATCSVSMCVDDLVQLDHYEAPEFPGRGHVKAVTVRAYDADADTWSIIWLCNYTAPDFDPLVGRWEGDEGPSCRRSPTPTARPSRRASSGAARAATTRRGSRRCPTTAARAGTRTGGWR